MALQEDNNTYNMENIIEGLEQPVNKVSQSISRREETNSAIGSWSGYIYQGLCGILVVLRMLKEDAEKYKNYSLQLDSYEDFSILDSNGKIVSLHQCKSDKNRKDYNDEFKKMKSKFESLDSNGMLQNPATHKYYFHCNREVEIDDSYNILAYQFETGKNYCEPGNIQALLDAEVQEMKKAGSDTHALRAALETIVNGDVLNTQQEFFEASRSGKLYVIARNKRIPFEHFAEVLQKNIMSYNPGDFLLQMKEAYIIGMEERASEDGDEKKIEIIRSFTKRLLELSKEDMIKFIQRVNPKDKIEDSYQCLRDFTSQERLNYLYYLVTDIPLNSDALHWITANSIQTPSTLGNDIPVRKASALIYKNQANLDLPWIYDWIVGHVVDHVDNIEVAANVINKIEEVSDNNIFHIKKVGILTKKEKQDGTFD